MKYANQIICLLSSLAWLGLSTNAYGNSQSAHGGRPEKLPSISKPQHPITLPKPETKYSMRIIEPSPSTECKIMYVMPDPDINYTIRNVGPKFGNPSIWENGRHDGTVRKHFRRK